MSIDDVVRATSRPYSATLKQFDWWGSLFTSRRLPFTMELQTQTNWCWAATSKSVSHYYWFLSPWRQCTIANAELGRNDACQTPVPAAANVPWYLDRALTRTNNFVSITAGRPTFAQIRAEVDAGRPMGARIGWNPSGGHFVAIYGYATWFGTEFVDIDDPIWGKSHMSLSDFSTNYRGNGTWTHYYITKSYRRWWWPDVIIPEKFYKKIWQARQFMLLKEGADPEHGLAEPAEEPSFGLGHRLYNLTLDEVLAGRADEPSPVGLRVYESVAGSPVAFFDVDESDEGNVRAMSKSAAHLDAFAAALAAAEHVMPRGDEGEEAQKAADAQASILTVPALNFEALWVRGRHGDPVLLPLTTVGELQVGHPYPFDEVMRILRSAAEPLRDMDDTMGA